MSEITTVARPYARAIFEYALAHHQLDAWSKILSALAQVMEDKEAVAFLLHPQSPLAARLELLDAVVWQASTEAHSPAHELLGLLCENKRLNLLVEIRAIFETLRQEAEQKITVNVESFGALSNAQQQDLIQKLSQKLNRQVELEIKTNPELLGGAVIRAGDLVIDGSVRGRLEKLATSLVA